MPRIGDYIRPELGAIDFMPGARATAEMQMHSGDMIAKALEGVGQVIGERRQAQSDVKASSKLIREAAEALPKELGGMVNIADYLDGKEGDLRDKLSVAKTIKPMMELGISKYESDRDYGLRDRALGLQEGQLGLENSRLGMEAAASSEKWQREQQAKAEQAGLRFAALEEGTAPYRDQLPEMPVMKSAIADYIKSGNGDAALAGVEAYEKQRAGQLGSMQKPRDLKPLKLGGKGPNNEPLEMDAFVSPDGGLFDIQGRPLNPAAAASMQPKARTNYAPETGVFRVPTTNYSTGKDAGGPDELQDKWTNRGYSATGPNLTPGIVAVNPKAYRLGTVFEDPDTGETFIAGDKHGNADPNVIDFYQDPANYTQAKGSRNLRVIGFEENVGKTPQELQAQLQRWQSTPKPPIPGQTQGASPGPEGSLILQYMEQAAQARGANTPAAPAARPGVDGEALARALQTIAPSGVQPFQQGQGPVWGQRPLVSPRQSPAEAQQIRRAESGDKRLETTMQEAGTLAGSIPALKQTAALLDKVQTGFGAETMTAAKRILGRDVSNAEQLQTLLGDQVMARVAQTKGAVSEKEMALFQDYSANFAKTPDGNRKIVAWQLAAAERAQKIQRVIADGFRAGKDPYAIEAEVIALRDAEPLGAMLTPPAPAPGGIPVDEDAENGWLGTKPTR